MKRAIIFAHYDRDKLIDDYVIYYLRALKDFGEIVFVSDCDINTEELKKLDGITQKNIVARHGEYDFGSYKRGFLSLDTNKYDEIIFCNDSCYAPLFPFSDMFDEMEKRDVDFWGVTQNQFGLYKKPNGKYRGKKLSKPHIQSYFFVIKKCTFKSFGIFVSEVKHENNKKDIVYKYENGLCRALEQYKFDTFVPLYPKVSDPTWNLKPRILFGLHKCPLLKVCVFKARLSRKRLLKYSKYPQALAFNHIKRNNVSLFKRFVGLFIEHLKRLVR